MQLTDILKFVELNSRNITRKWSIDNDSIIINHIDNWDWYKYIILILAISFISSILFVSSTLYSYSDILLNPYLMFIFILINILFYFVYKYLQRPILKINFKKKIIITPDETIFFNDIKKYFCKKIYILTSYKITSNWYNVLIQLPNGQIINLIDIKTIDKSKELCKILKNNFNKS